ncbi:helicase-related protein [Balneola sp. MJW-20]|uniref:helicase-related protein n=1 Tax=Gracilimonas aurantiaca TaxID=3234185 RepID=UPI003467BFCA
MSGLSDARIDEPTPLQKNVIPSALEGKNLLVKNDSEDAGAVLIPALQKLMSNGEAKGTKVLILTPSIEKAQKLDEMIWAIGYHAQISSGSLSMKGDRDEQEQILRDGSPIIVANPGRLIELLEKNNLVFDDLELLVIDDAQDMNNFNLVKRVKSILEQIKSEPQTLLFSSDYNGATRELVEAALKEPELIGFDRLHSDARDESDSDKEKEANEKPEDAQHIPSRKKDEKDEEPEQKEASVKGENSASNEEPEPIVKNLEQGYIYVPPRMKISTLLAHLEKTLTDRIVVFAASKRTTDRLFRIIRKKGWGVVSINEGLDEKIYNERFEKFTKGDMKILLVGGISATGLDLNEANQVINYDVPNEVDEYRYRAELVGKGKATSMISLVSKMDKEDIDRIVAEVGYKPAEMPLPEEVKNKKQNKNNNKGSGGNKSRKSSGRNNSNRNKDNDRNRKNDRRKSEKPKRRKEVSQQKKKSSHDLPRPSFEGLSGGREGDGKRPSPSDKSGPFGWIKKLFD